MLDSFAKTFQREQVASCPAPTEPKVSAPANPLCPQPDTSSSVPSTSQHEPSPTATREHTAPPHLKNSGSNAPDKSMSSQPENHLTPEEITKLQHQIKCSSVKSFKWVDPTSIRRFSKPHKVGPLEVHYVGITRCEIHCHAMNGKHQVIPAQEQVLINERFPRCFAHAPNNGSDSNGVTSRQSSHSTKLLSTMPSDSREAAFQMALATRLCQVPTVKTSNQEAMAARLGLVPTTMTTANPLGTQANNLVLWFFDVTTTAPLGIQPHNLGWFHDTHFNAWISFQPEMITALSTDPTDDLLLEPTDPPTVRGGRLAMWLLFPLLFVATFCRHCIHPESLAFNSKGAFPALASPFFTIPSKVSSAAPPWPHSHLASTPDPPIEILDPSADCLISSASKRGFHSKWFLSSAFNQVNSKVESSPSTESLFNGPLVQIANTSVLSNEAPIPTVTVSKGADSREAPTFSLSKGAQVVTTVSKEAPATQIGRTTVKPVLLLQHSLLTPLRIPIINGALTCCAASVTAPVSKKVLAVATKGATKSVVLASKGATTKGAFTAPTCPLFNCPDQLSAPPRMAFCTAGPTADTSQSNHNQFAACSDPHTVALATSPAPPWITCHHGQSGFQIYQRPSSTPFDNASVQLEAPSASVQAPVPLRATASRETSTLLTPLFPQPLL